MLLNFKRLCPVEKVGALHSPVRICYFSRIIEQKGIEDAVNAVNTINMNGERCIFDIYGPIVDEYAERFDKLQQGFSEGISYKGKINPMMSINILKDYDLQIFPTRYRTEGIPGSIIDSYFAGVPVLVSRWNSYSDVVKERTTGISYEFGDLNDLILQLDSLLNEPNLLQSMKEECIKESKKYTPRSVINYFIREVQR